MQENSRTHANRRLDAATPQSIHSCGCGACDEPAGSAFGSPPRRAYALHPPPVPLPWPASRETLFDSEMVGRVTRSCSTTAETPPLHPT